MMSNVISVSGIVPAERHIWEMKEGEVGYTVPWAYNDDWLDEKFTIGPKGGTASLRVERIKPRRYALIFETPVWA